MLCASTTPGTRSAAAATRSLGRSSASAAGSTCTCTCARPSESRTACSTRSVVSWVFSSPSSRETPMTTSAKLSPPASRTRTDRTSATPTTLRTTRSTAPARPDGARSIEHVDVAAAEPHGGDQHDRGHEDRGHRVAAGHARRREAEADEHRHRPREVRPEVPGVCHQRRVSLPAALAQRHRRANGVDHEHEQDHREHVRLRVDRRAAGAQPQHGLDARSRRRRRTGTRPRPARPGAVPCRGRTDARDRAAARPPRPRTASARRTPRRCPSGPPRPARRGSRWRARSRA